MNENMKPLLFGPHSEHQHPLYKRSGVSPDLLNQNYQVGPVILTLSSQMTLTLKLKKHCKCTSITHIIAQGSQTQMLIEAKPVINSDSAWF